jgi:hypothetical protein
MPTRHARTDRGRHSASCRQSDRHDWPASDLERTILHELPRRFRGLLTDAQADVLAAPPPFTHTQWDALLAHVTARRWRVYDSPRLVITGMSAEHLLAMKLEAAHRTDRADIAGPLQTVRCSGSS